MRVAVVGAGGYAGGELLRLLLEHPEVGEVRAVSRSQAGKTLGEVHPALARAGATRFAGLEPAEAARDADVLFLALEHGESSRIMAGLVDAGAGLIVDLAADFRIADGRLYERYYGPHPAPSLVHRFVYGLADVAGSELRGATGIAAPGCFATAAALAILPLRGFALATEPTVYAITGSSGVGISPKSTTHHPARAHNVFAYSVTGHRHEAEIAEQWRRWTGRPAARPRVLAHSGPFVRGIYASAHARLLAPEARSVVSAAEEAFRDRPFVRLLERPPELTHAVGTNDALIHLAVGDDETEVQIFVAIDNLIKGAGGQAIQAMNLSLGLDERSGLELSTPFPI